MTDTHTERCCCDPFDQPQPATRHWCINRREEGAGLLHTAGSGRPRRRRCAGCGSQIVVQAGWWGVFTHSASPGAGPSGARYERADARSLHSRERDAQRLVDADTTGTLVVRWVAC